MPTTLAPTRGRIVAAFALAAVVLAECVAAVVATVLSGVGPAAAVDGFVVTNVAIGLSFGVAGWLIAWQRPARALGWLLSAAAVCQAAPAAAGSARVLGVTAGWPQPALDLLGTVAAYAWPWSIAVLFPLALLVFPDGLLPGRFWRAVVVVVAATGPVFVVSAGADPAGALPSPMVLPEATYRALGALWTAEEIVNLLVLGIAAIGLVLRYRRGDEQRRRQLLWLVLALVIMIAVLVPWALFDAGPILQLLVIALVPAAMTIAVLRHQLLDIRLVLSRTVLYALLSAGVVGCYAGLVAGTDLLLRDGAGPGTSVLVTLLIAIGFNPVRVRLQRTVDRALYGDRADPVRAVARMGEQLRAGSGTDLADVLAAVCEALRLPYAAVRDAAHGSPPELLESVPLVYRGEQVGELVVGVRRGQSRLDRVDRAALELLVAPVAVAVHATVLTAAVQRSREQIVAAREEERRRLRRDLHDGLGPALTGITFQADAAGNVLESDPGRAATLLTALRAAAGDAIDDVRRLVYALRPPALDELGLVGALQRHAEQLGAGAPGVTIHAPPGLPTLPAAVEVAAYRVGVEALTNAMRHSGAHRVDLRVAVEDGTDLVLTVCDDGRPSAAWTAGVGLASMRERAVELGGSVQAGPGAAGGRVALRLPL